MREQAIIRREPLPGFLTIPKIFVEITEIIKKWITYLPKIRKIKVLENKKMWGALLKQIFIKLLINVLYKT